MAEINTSNTSSTPPVAHVASVQATGPAGAKATSNPTASLPSSTPVGSLENLQATSPEIYKFMMRAIAQNIMVDLGRRERRLEEALKKLGDDQDNS